MTPRKVSTWDCGKPSCTDMHMSLEDAALCAGVVEEVTYACGACGDLYSEEIDADNCCGAPQWASSYAARRVIKDWMKRGFISKEDLKEIAND